MTASGRLFLLALALLAALTLPSLLRVGMFFDGVTSAAIARNLAEGTGTFWAPHYTETAHPRMFEFFPLGLWLQSWVYRAFGDHLALDRLWNLGMGVGIVGLLAWVWRLTAAAQPPSAGGWWPALLFLSAPLVAATLRHNGTEATLTVFALAASAAGLRAVGHSSPAGQAGYGAASGLLLLGALLAKGPQGLFPLVLPLAAPVFLPGVPWRAARTAGLAMLGALGTGLAVLLLADAGARESFAAVLGDRVLASLEGRRGQSSRWRMLWRLGRDLAVPLALGLLGALVGRRPVGTTGAGRAGFFLALGAAASLPFLVSPIQYARYLFPSLPFFAAAVAALFNATGLQVEAIASRPAGRRAVALLVVLSVAAAAALMVARAGTIERDPEFHRHLTRPALRLEGRPTIAVCPPRLASDWPFVANMQRVFRASLTKAWGGPLRLVESAAACPLPPGCAPLGAGPRGRYTLYRCPAGPL